MEGFCALVNGGCCKIISYADDIYIQFSVNKYTDYSQIRLIFKLLETIISLLFVLSFLFLSRNRKLRTKLKNFKLSPIKQLHTPKF